jgi:cysteine desulfurase / selenocysteine lyase
MGSPSGVGVLYGKKDWIEKLPAYEGGADMVKEVSFEHHKLSAPPYKFEAGTTPFAEIISLNTLIDFLNEVGMDKIEQYEQELLAYATRQLSNIDRVTIMGTNGEKEPVISFVVEGVDLKKLERFLNDEHNMVVRTGELGAQPLMKILGVSGLMRASLSFYNTREEIDLFAGAVEEYIKRKG